MPRRQGVSAENNFIRGLITETTAIKFPENACTETDNVVFDETGRVTRRLGYDLETGYTLPNVASSTTNTVFSEYVWDTVSGNGTLSFFVLQVGRYIHFYDISVSTNLGPNKKSFTVDLANHLPTYSTRDPSLFPCSFAAGNGDLVVNSEAVLPFYVDYNIITDTISTNFILIKYRDFKGSPDEGGLTERPIDSVASLITNRPNHYYNILNQGWYTGDALSQWDTARTDMPSNADRVGLFRASATDAFDNAVLAANDPGNSPAPKGHFLLTLAEENRRKALTDAGFSDAGITEFTPEISRLLGTIVDDFTSQESLAFDGVTSAVSGSCALKSAVNGYIGKDWGSSTTFPVHSAIVYGGNDSGFINGANVSMTMQLRGSNSAPSGPTSGTLLSEIVFTDTGDERAGRFLYSNDTVTRWRYIFISVYRDDAASADWRIAEIRFFTTNFTFERPSTNCFFASRLWYSGFNYQDFASNIYFTQIIEGVTEYGTCYQKQDPTSEDFSDLLPDDGGVIKIPEIGKVVKLFPFKSALIILATNGVWLIGGSTGSSFAANDFTVKKLSGIGTSSALSVVDAKGTPIWWAEDGIYTLTYDANYDSTEVVSLTDPTILTYIQNIPSLNRVYVKGTFDSKNNIIYWLFNDTASLTVSNYYRYNRVLAFNIISKAFYPFSTLATSPSIRSITYIETPSQNSQGVVKLVLTTPDNATTEKLTYGEIKSAGYKDWITYATDILLDANLASNYSSYFITGYKLDGDGQRFFQSNYVFVFLEQLTNSSCLVQGIFDWTTSSSTGKWSTQQQIYKSSILNRAVNFRRLKIRGKGRSLQLRFESETGKPFTIIGWSIWETANAAV